ncbi:aminotransferase class I/II-fold pyridoxal phosphate-dependent enzyme [Pelagibacterales bacterium SAG-MED37]|nr:aminotransferase class I/II-fold pyridoxal phosphate-dependent enzyme [Pelagibacterales bacterium SAG-MED37]
MHSNIKITSESSIKSAMAKIDKNAMGIVFVVNSSDKLVGVLTDGDIRRAILKGANIFSSCKSLMRKKFIKVKKNDSKTKVLELLQKYKNIIKVIPIINEKEKLIDYATTDRLNFIPIYYPRLKGNELKYLSKCVTGNWISSNGPFVQEFEQKFSSMHNKRLSLAVSSGTTALHLSLVALGIKKGDEVIVPNLTFAAVINAVLYIGAKPVIVDVDEKKWTINPDEIKHNITKKTKAVIVVHFLGNPCNLGKIKSICKSNKIFLVEDCAEAIGSKYKKKLVGTFGDCSTFSFFGNKTITTGEGGMITFKDKKIYKKANILRDHGMSKKKRYFHDEVGFNYRMTNMQAAIGLAQLEKFKDIINEKIQIFNFYKKNLGKNKYITFQKTENKGLNTYWLIGVKFHNKKIIINELQNKMLKNGIETRNFFYPLNVQKIYSNFKTKNNYLAQKVFDNSIMLPSFPGIKYSEIKFISKVLLSSIK